MEAFNLFFGGTLPAAVLCHGVFVNVGKEHNGRLCGHAWIEAGDVVIDPANNFVGRKELYYSVGKVQHVKRFTFEQARLKALRVKHYGPWNPKIEKAESWRKGWLKKQRTLGGRR